MDTDLLVANFRVSGRQTHVRTLDPSLPAEVQVVIGTLGGVSLDDGLYRCFSPESVNTMTALSSTAFPEYAQRVVCFGADWLGRLFAADEARREPAGGERMVLMLEPGTGDALEIPMSVTAFHERGLVLDAESALAQGFYRTWRESSGDDKPLRSDECVGYQVPLFLGGSDEVRNLERTDVAVYWTLCGQLRQQAQELPPGTPIKGIDPELPKRGLFRRK